MTTKPINSFLSATTLTISAGVIDVVQGVHVVAAEAGTTDDLDTINNGSFNRHLSLMVDSGDSITIKNGIGNINTGSGNDITVEDDTVVRFLYDPTFSIWRVISTSVVNNDNWFGSSLSIANGGTGASTLGGAQTALGINALIGGTTNTVQKADGSGGLSDSSMTDDGSTVTVAADLQLASGKTLTNEGGTPDIGDSSNPFGAVYAQQAELRYGAAITLLLGADSTGSSLTNSTIKRARVGTPHYDTAEQPAAILFYDAGATGNHLYLGGGTASFNAATEIRMCCAANNTTVTGTQVGRWISDGLELASGKTLTNEGGTPDIGSASNPFGSVHPQAIEFDPVAANPGDSETLWANSTDSNKLYYGSSEVGGSGGEWNTTTTQETSSSSYTFTSSDIGKLKAFTNSGDTDGRLPALDSTYDNKIIMIGNLDKTNTKTVTIDCNLADRIGQSGYGWGIDLPDPGATIVTLLGDLDNHRWHIVNAVGGRVLDEGCKLYERCDKWLMRERTQTTSISIDDTRQHVAIPERGVEIIDGEIGVGCWDFPGSNEYVYYADSSDWDIANTGVYTILVRFKIDSSRRHELMAHYEDTNNRWRLHIDGSDNVNFNVVSGGTTQIDLTSTTTVNDGSWHTVVVHKTGTTYGLYIDGSQEDYDTWASTDTFSGYLYVGQNGASANYLNGKINQIGIWHQDRFDATPDSGSTDTITVPDNHLTVNYGT